MSSSKSRIDSVLLVNMSQDTDTGGTYDFSFLSINSDIEVDAFQTGRIIDSRDLHSQLYICHPSRQLACHFHFYPVRIGL